MAIVENGESKTETSGTNKRRVWLQKLISIQARSSTHPLGVGLCQEGIQGISRQVLHQAHEFSALDAHALHPRRGLERRGYRQCS
ncbi:hypothetical protein COLO4_27352 [Corchorus olitorius]|uniref:Uncharacterized protein n=1 Tax=Corchorus olitorius TaxID=93759 RepID=A0A1R3HS23_9ROSI|nr:hypothetical protein COLO4_27352 [Corchorus olitorius]